MLIGGYQLGIGVKLSMQRFFKKIYQHVINPPGDAELKKAWQVSSDQLPTLWLLGKTGSGKSSIVQKLTGQSGAEIGNGFMPCTKDASAYDYPSSLPIMRFLDTRGLGEAGYDPREDIQALGESSHALLIAMCITDSQQSEVLEAIRLIRKSHSMIGDKRVIVVHTAVTRISDEHDRQRAVAEKQDRVEKAWGTALDFCTVDFHETGVEGVLNELGADELRDILIGKLPELSLWLEKSEHRDAEQANFERLKQEILWYAAAVAGTDAIPAVGLFSVPSIQGKMLHSLAQKYELKWDRRNFAEFTGALGASALLWYGASLGGRQLVKLIPVYGQIAGTAFAMSVSYASTYAIGRAACSYLYHKKTKTALTDSDLQNIYKKAVKQGRAAKEKMGKEGGP
ncbi:MAG: hypothetical protein ACI89U_003062 [Gammaproteobacteria bacterium]|jgi:uncharacterized protein (DUF697 family)